MIFLIIGITSIVFVLLFGLISIQESCGILICTLNIGIVCLGMVFIMSYFKKTLTAKDVYQGKTELRITYEDKIPIDSVVIYK